eukprot:gene23260-35174_t
MEEDDSANDKEERVPCKVDSCTFFAKGSGVCIKHGAYGNCAAKGCAKKSQSWQFCTVHFKAVDRDHRKGGGISGGGSRLAKKTAPPREASAAVPGTHGRKDPNSL